MFSRRPADAIPTPTPALAGPGIRLRAPAADDFQAWAALREASRDFLVPWEPAWTSRSLTRSNYRLRLKRHARERRDGSAHAFFIFRENDGALLGGVNLSAIRRGVSLSASLGYWVGAAHARQGYMTGALESVAAWAFGPLGLHRLEAACLPENAASRALLARTGFREEGVAREYLCIAGRWQDHLIHARLAGDRADRRA